MLLSDFDYYLPQQLIAQTPIYPRNYSRLLVMDRQTGELTHRHFYDLFDYVTEGDTLVFNDTRVIPARLIGCKRDTGAKIEVFLLTQLNDREWEVLVKPGKKAKIGVKIDFGPEISCEVLRHTDFGGRVVRFDYEGVFFAILDRLGTTPLPPYIKEQLNDAERYQTVYAKEKGSAAAPTAGLHFTREMMEELQKRGVNTVFITLHVGLGTFRPVSETEITNHKMHREYYSIPGETARIINEAKERGKRVIAVGTTAIRTLETVGRENRIQAGTGWTGIFIYPGYRFQVIDGMITNFHLPQSTLLMLVSAFAGREHVLQAYEEAVRSEYRFFSFGDAMLIL
ncbi:tRNA preQ1(34) S-adenosylmethionine ribosyltransferase-isomerase QueA [Acetonema longum]|uniref:S-adenosylmethionine:tRNA ribosyltransferase-isomerase n=1 Tax=Acetonema longum DSM 6540 TaxID=1009370 RepID=F7NQ93_9FIRM|nr:tRNA preQ1(34) S-adenosylmethionine ribosyltransferase-isomerase QueA [Acetonema longum]EGO61852.1 S-adenosylmethionine:tRNA ribosyltransferase-isomerase [Acetonema longum DSM 6540]